jgi:hypothetical protein
LAILNFARSLKGWTKNTRVAGTSVNGGIAGQQNSRGVRHWTGVVLREAWPPCRKSFGLQCAACSLTGYLVKCRIAAFPGPDAFRCKEHARTKGGRLGHIHATLSKNFSLPSLALNPLTYNAPLSGAEVRSTEASTRTAG